ncbi:glycosyltransferase family 4 protein [Microbispora sp. CA-102843]|uniref:glycosyltransferase family 4 protein n=1 Tax=Microbispora sp. CA-102843 TaxID=3239952 RepID=UPI003D8BDB45
MSPLSVLVVGASAWRAGPPRDDPNVRTAQALADRLGGRYDIVCPCGDAAPGTIDLGAVRVHRVRTARRAAFVPAARRVVDGVAASGTHVLMSSDPLAALAVESSRARRALPHIFQVQGEILSPGPEYGGRLKRLGIALATRSAVRRATAVRVVREGMRPIVESLTSRPVVYLGSRVDTRLFTPQAGGERASVAAVMVGGLLPVKNHLTVVRAWQRVAAAFPDARLLLLGEGPCRPELETAIGELGLRDHVELRGAVPHRQVAALLRTAGCLLHPSWSEGQPRAVLEAMACGLPVICSDITAHREIAVPPAARLVAPGDVGGWAEAVSRLLADPAAAAAAGRHGREFVTAHHDFETQMDRYAELILSVAALGPTAAAPS